MRQPPQIPVPVIMPVQHRNRVNYGCLLVTPMIGGGAIPHQRDEHQLIRGASIRGQLRFWWRATRGGLFRTLAELKAAEDRIWGSTEHPSQVQIAVQVLKPGKESEQVALNHPLAYGAFPLHNGKLKDEPKGTMRRGLEFELEVEYPPELGPDVEAAIWAWTTFGGLGARTRRGFGAVQLWRIQDDDHVMPANLSAWAQQLRQGKEKHVVPALPPVKGIPSLHQPAGSIKIPTTSFGSAEAALRHGLDKLRAFRQRRRPGSDPAMPRRLGRSHWPEPDQLRRLTGQSDPNHRKPLTEVKRFPRAVFGLPIVFHFQSRTDPGDCFLQGPAGLDRLASPLIIRPLECEDGTSFIMATVLSNVFSDEQDLVPGGLHVLERGRTLAKVEHRLSEEEARALAAQRTDNNNGFVTPPGPDVLAAFLAEFATVDVRK